MSLRNTLKATLVSLACIATSLAQSYSYDEAGRLTRVVYVDGGGIAYSYDDADNLLAAVVLAVPPVPMEVTATRLSETSARVMWPSVDDATGYRIERREEPSGEWQEVGTVSGAANSFVDSTLEAGKDYTYRIAATSADGSSAYSNEAGFGSLGDPLISEGGVLNGASFEDRPLVPGSIFSIFGPNLGMRPTEFGGVEPFSAVAGQPPQPLELGGYTVEVAGLQAPMYFVGSGQINAILPWNTPPGQRELIVRQTVDGEVLESEPYMIDVATVGPALFTFDPGGVGKVVGINASNDPGDGVQNGSVTHPADAFEFFPSQPAPLGGVVIFYATGLGAVSPTIADGAAITDGMVRNTNVPVEVFIGGARAEVAFSGLAPQFPGVNQINVVVPLGAVPGNAVPVRIEQGGVVSQPGVVMAIE